MEKLGKEYLKELAEKYGRNENNKLMKRILDAYDEGEIVCCDHVDEKKIRSLTEREIITKGEVEEEFSCHVCLVVLEDVKGMPTHYYVISPVDKDYKKELITYGYAIVMVMSLEKSYTNALRIRPDEIGFTCW